MTRKIFPVKCSYVFTDSNGKMVSDCVYEDAKGNDYFNAYKVGKKWGFIDNDGNNITDAIYDTVSLIDNVAIVKNNDACYMLNNNFDKIIPDSFCDFKHIKCNDFNYFILYDVLLNISYVQNFFLLLMFKVQYLFNNYCVLSIIVS